MTAVYYRIKVRGSVYELRDLKKLRRVLAILHEEEPVVHNERRITRLRTERTFVKENEVR